MPMFLHSYMFRVFLPLFLVFSFSGCFAKKDDKSVPFQKVQNPSLLYKKGLDNLKAGRLYDAIKKFEAINHQHPYSTQARKAILLQAFTNYRYARYEEAIDSARRYIQLYPTSQTADSAQYIIGLSYFEQIQDVSRDQKPSREVITAMEELITRWPQSLYVIDAKDKIRFAREQLAGHEMQIGRYYLERRAYVSAITRFRYVQEHYPNTRHAEESFGRLIEAYYAIGLVPEAHSTFNLLAHKYPKGQWLKITRNLLGIKSTRFSSRP